MKTTSQTAGRKKLRSRILGGLKVAAIGASALLLACQTSTSSRSPQGLAIPSPEQNGGTTRSPGADYRPKPGLNPRERFRYALDLLNRDQAQEALIELETYLLNRPRDPRAKRIVKQITLPTSELYPPNSFPVKLKWGQTLSSLSRDYLGDVFSFYGLAKYNGIPVSTPLIVGDTINIPATAKALAAREQLKIRPTTGITEEKVYVDDELLPAEAEELADIEKLTEPQPAATQTYPEPEAPEPAEDTELALIESSQPVTVEEEPKHVTTLLDVIAGDPEAFIRNAMAQESYVVAATTLEELKANREISPGLAAESSVIYQRAANALETEDPNQSGEYYYLAGLALLDKGDRDAALPLLKRSVELNPTNNAAASVYRKTQARLASSYHRLATNAYRKQELDEAIALWEYVLEIDPDYSAAKTFLVQANELKAKLSKIREQ